MAVEFCFSNSTKVNRLLSRWVSPVSYELRCFSLNHDTCQTITAGELVSATLQDQYLADFLTQVCQPDSPQYAQESNGRLGRLNLKILPFTEPISTRRVSAVMTIPTFTLYPSRYQLRMLLTLTGFQFNGPNKWQKWMV